MLEQQHRVWDQATNTCSLNALLQLERVSVRDPPEPVNDDAAHQRFMTCTASPSACLKLSMTASPNVGCGWIVRWTSSA